MVINPPNIIYVLASPGARLKVPGFFHIVTSLRCYDRIVGKARRGLRYDPFNRRDAAYNYLFAAAYYASGKQSALLATLGPVFLCYLLGLLLSWPMKAISADMTLASDFRRSLCALQCR